MPSAPNFPHEQLASAIRSAGVRVTPARLRVLALLQASPAPLSHTQIEDLLSQGGQTALDRVTLYRVLDSLADSGLAHKAADARGVFRFSAAQADRQHQSHTHFRCTHCGGVFCLDMPPPPPPALPPGFHLASMEVDIRGECANCSHSSPTQPRITRNELA